MVIIKFIKSLFYLAMIAVVIGLCLGVVMVIVMGRDLPQLPDKLEKLVLNTQTEFYSSTGQLLTTLGERNRVPIDRISSNFVNALLAAEDFEFYDHSGISKRGIIRAVYQNIRAGKIAGGASTITQQLSRNFFLSLEQTHSRKIKEILLSLQLEYSFSKDEILEAYCNNMYFGSGAYGVEAASRVYFARHADQLSLAQSSLLVAILNGPGIFNPYSNPGRARSRQLWILDQMEYRGFITPQERLAAENEKILLKRYTETTGRSSYYLDYVQQRVRELFGDEFLYYGGLRIYTTLDQRMQAAGVAAVQAGLERLDSQFGLPGYSSARQDKESRAEYPQATLVAVENGTGAVLAMIGGRNYNDTQFNRAVQSNRLPGSAFKPFVYFTAMRNLGLSPASTLVDSAVTFQLPNGQIWEPHNFENDFIGRMTLKKALEKSRNVISAELIDRTGPEQVVLTAHNFGIISDIPATPAISLGALGVSPLEMAASYSVFASGGTYYEPFVIRRIEDQRGNILYDHIPRGEDVANPQLVYQMVDMMQNVVDRGTGYAVRRMGFTLPAAGKTGTTSDYRDSWFVGYTPSLSVASWVGFDDNREMRITMNGRKIGLTGSLGGAPIWALFMSKVTEGKARQEFPIPPGIEFLSVDAWTGLPASSDLVSVHGRELIQAPLLPEQLEAIRQKSSVEDTLDIVPGFDPLNF